MPLEVTLMPMFFAYAASYWIVNPVPPPKYDRILTFLYELYSLHKFHTLYIL